MLEEYFVRLDTVDRIRACWIGAEIERYVVWLVERGYRPRTVLHRVPLLVGFAEFAQARGARCVAELPAHVESFVADRVEHRQALRRGSLPKQEPSKEFRGRAIEPPSTSEGSRARPIWRSDETLLNWLVSL